jgi:D-proline reductase (dithiol) PrdB
MIGKVDSYRFLDGVTKRMVKTWVNLEPLPEIPWTPLDKPLSECTVALISSAALALKNDTPFDQEIERQNPWISDPSYRVLPAATRTGDVILYHLHVASQFVDEDLNVLMPLELLEELAQSGEIGRLADSHYTYMGYTLDPCELLETSTPAIIRNLRDEAVDVVVLVPA